MICWRTCKRWRSCRTLEDEHSRDTHYPAAQMASTYGFTPAHPPRYDALCSADSSGCMQLVRQCLHSTCTPGIYRTRMTITLLRRLVPHSIYSYTLYIHQLCTMQPSCMAVAPEACMVYRPLMYAEHGIHTATAAV